MRAIVVYLLAFAAVVIGLAFAFPQWRQWLGFEQPAAAGADNRGNAAPPVVVALAARDQFVDVIEALGTVIANESVDISPNRADHIVALHFEDGQQVEAGDLLVEMNTTEERALLAESVALRDQRLEDLDRANGLFEREMLSERELDAARTAVAAAEARVASIEAGIADREIRAPFAGVLGLRRVSVGAYVQPGVVITTLDDLSVVKLDFTIPETWLSAVERGMTIRARSEAWPDGTFAGTITQIDTRLDPRSRSATVRALLPNPELRLRPGMLLEVRVQRGEVPVLQIPEESLIPVGTDNFVFRIGPDSRAERVQVEIGRRRPGAVEVTSGLEEGDKVVTDGLVRVRANAPVQIVATREP